MRQHRIGSIARAALAGGARTAIVLAAALYAVSATAQQTAAPAMFERIAPPAAPGPELPLYSDKLAAGQDATVLVRASLAPPAPCCFRNFMRG